MSIPQVAAQHRTLGFFIDPSNPCSSCSITIRNNTISATHTNNTFAPYSDGVYNITANGAAGFSFHMWSVNGGLSVSNATKDPAQLFVSGSGNITALFNPPSTASLTCGTSKCAVLSNSTIASTLFNSGNHTLIVTFRGTTGTGGFANITVPKAEVFNSDPNSITVFRNTTQLPSSSVTITSNATDFFVYATFTFHSGVRMEYLFFPLQSQSIPPYFGLGLILLIAPVVISIRSRIKNRQR